MHLLSRYALWSAAFALLMTAIGCGDDDATLLVEVRTDLVPAQEFSRVSVSYFGDDGTERSDDVTVSAGDDFVRGQRVASFSAPAGLASVDVSLIDRSGRVVLTRQTRLAFSGVQPLLVVMTRSCQNVTCPSPLGDPEHITCSGGQCVPPECASGSTEPECGTRCSGNTDCPFPPGSTCSTGLCQDGTCLLVIVPDSCAANEMCSPEVGCVPTVPLPDGGTPDGGTPDGGDCAEAETSCLDGLDDDCDGLLDCADPDCMDALCDDGNNCTENDTCGTGRTCAGTLVACDDGVLCTTDRCEPGMGCVFENNAVVCDNGLYCDGNDFCMDGSCSGRGEPPCAEFCNESTERCEMCSSASDCGAVTYGDWSACGGFTGGTCDESGTRSRIVFTPACTGGSCTTTETTGSEACSRPRAGISCGAAMFGDWSGCSYANACATSGTRTRTRTNHVCAGGICEARPRTVSGTCGRGSQEHAVCSLDGRSRCCGGTCHNLDTSTTHCGGCGLSCASGQTCGMRAGHPTCGCSDGFHGTCAGSTGSCSGSTRLCSCDAAFGGSCPAAMSCLPLSGGADVCIY